MIRFQSFASRILKSAFCTIKQDSSKQIYIYPYNVNKQQHKPYLQQVERQINNTLTAEVNTVPRRKRRLYDRPPHDLNLDHYGAWRLFGDQRITVLGEEYMPMSFKFSLVPKQVKHAFGLYHNPDVFSESSSGEYWFQDNNLSQYILVEYRNTTAYQRNDPQWDYQNQNNIQPRKRKVKRLQPKQFWQSQTPAEFRVYGTKYSECFKFKKWILKQIEERKSKQSYDDQINQRFGKVSCYNEFQQTGSGVIYPAAVEKITVSAYSQKKQTKKKGKQVQKQVVAEVYKLPRKPEQQFRVNETMTVFLKQEKDNEQQQQKNASKNIKPK